MLWNVKGLDRPKWQAVFTSPKRCSPSICLQETNLNSDTLHYLKRNRFNIQYNSIYTTYSREVSILVSNWLDFLCRHIRKDSNALIFFALNIIRPTIRLKIYIFPRLVYWKYLKNILRFVSDKPESAGLLVGDFNNYMDPAIDKCITDKKNFIVAYGICHICSGIVGL